MCVVLTVEKVYGEGIPPVIGPAAVSIASSGSDHNDIYVMAGFNSISHGSLVRLRIPKDLCYLQTDKNSCTSMLGCAACLDEDANITYCYTNDDPARFE